MNVYHRPSAAKSSSITINDDGDEALLLRSPKHHQNINHSWLLSSKPLMLLIFLIGISIGNLTAFQFSDGRHVNQSTTIVAMTKFSRPTHNASLNQSPKQSADLSPKEINQMIKQYLPMVNYIPPSLPIDFSMVIPSFHGHITHLTKYLMTMRRYCVECTRLPLIVVVGNNEKPMFTERVVLNPNIGPYFANISIVTLPEITTLPWHIAANQTGYWQNRKCDDSKGNNQCIRSKFVHQSLKKMYGCLHASTRFCWASDSESLFVRPVTVKALLQDYIDDPFIISHTWTKFNAKNDPVHSVVRQALGIHSRFGRLLEYYMWVYDRSILAEVEQIMKRRIPKLDDFSEAAWLFIEVTYYAYIVHNQRRFPQYRVLDMPDLYEPTWLSQLDRHDFTSPVEEARTVWDQAPQFRNGINAMHSRFNLKAHRCSQNPHLCGQFVDANPGVVLLLSEQPAGVFEQSMMGAFVIKSNLKHANDTSDRSDDKNK